MRRCLRAISLATGLLLLAACFYVRARSLHHVFDLHRDFFYGRFDGDRTWRGSYLSAYRGQLAFELDTIRYSTAPTTAPARRWEAEDAVGLRTSVFRPLPFDGPLGFCCEGSDTVGPAGSLRISRLAVPLWVFLLPSALLLFWPLWRLLLQLHPGAARNGFPVETTGG